MVVNQVAVSLALLGPANWRPWPIEKPFGGTHAGKLAAHEPSKSKNIMPISKSSLTEACFPLSAPPPYASAPGRLSPVPGQTGWPLAAESCARRAPHASLDKHPIYAPSIRGAGARPAGGPIATTSTPIAALVLTVHVLVGQLDRRDTRWGPWLHANHTRGGLLRRPAA
jgi:hypothetical protein